MGTDYPIFQEFKSKDHRQLRSLPTHVSDTDGVRYVLWSDIQLAFKDIYSLYHYATGNRVLFMVDKDSVRLHLCIAYRDDAYYVVRHHEQGDQLRDSYHMLSTIQTAGIVAEQDSYSGQEWIQDPSNNKSVVHLNYLLRSLMELNYELLNGKSAIFPTDFWQEAANAGYYSLRALEELERLEGLGIKIQGDGMANEQLHAYLHESRQEALLAEYRYTCGTLLHKSETRFHYPVPKLFLVLPADLDSWDDSDPTTHSFRFYFMCDNRQEEGAPEGMPQHVHLSSHAGYNIKQPREFFQAYGDYVLRILQMVEHGYSDDDYNVPPLDTFEILLGCDTAVTGGGLCKDTIRSLIAKTIAYLLELPLPKWIKHPGLSRVQSAMIKTFLDIPDGTPAEGNLQKYIGSKQHVYWRCQEHARQRLNPGILHGLKEFVESHGVIDMQQSAVQVELLSPADADQFGALLKGTNHAFEKISIRLSWAATRASLKQICQVIADTKAVFLKLDGVTLDTHPQGHVQYIHHFFQNVVSPSGGSLFLTLLNYPRPEEVCYYRDNLSIQSKSSQGQRDFLWLKLVQEAKKFSTSVDRARGVSGYSRAASTLKSALEKEELPEVTFMGYSRGYPRIRVTIFDMKELAIIEVYSSDITRHAGVLLSGSLKRLTVHVDDPLECNELSRVVQINTLLQELNISYYGHDVLFYLEHIVKIWLDSSTSSRLTLIDRMRDTQGRIIAQLSRRRDSQSSEPIATPDVNTNPSSSTQKQMIAHPDIEFLQWDCDHIFSQLSDYSASILNMATQRHPEALAMLTLDISRLSRKGLVSVQNVLSRSNLELLNVVCTPVQPSMSDPMARVLGSVQWSTLKSLKLSGDDIDRWIHIWMTPCSNPFTSSASHAVSHLLSLHVQGIGSAPQLLSHVSAMFVHGIAYWSPSVEVLLQNVILKEDFS